MLLIDTNARQLDASCVYFVAGCTTSCTDALRIETDTLACLVRSRVAAMAFNPMRIGTLHSLAAYPLLDPCIFKGLRCILVLQGLVLQMGQ